MSATVDTNSPVTWRKRTRSCEDEPQVENKRPRYYYFRLESESSKCSEEDTESVYSLQDRETDLVRDTSDTESRAGTISGNDEYEVQVEYEVASLSEDDNYFSNSSSGSEGMMLAAAAAVICDSSLEAWITDCEDSDNSSMEDTSLGRTGYPKCMQCKMENKNSLYTYCEKCFQSCRKCKMRKTYKSLPLCNKCYKDRKKFFPPRPRRNKSKKKAIENPNQPVKLDTLRNCLSGLSQDSGIGSSQECPPLDLHEIVVPEHLTPGTSKLSSNDMEKNTSVELETPLQTSSVGGSLGEKSGVESQSSGVSSMGSRIRKRQISESSLSDFEVKKPRRQPAKKPGYAPLEITQTKIEKLSDLGSEVSSKSFISKSSTDIEEGSKGSFTESNSELCIFCNDAPKDSIFLHTNIAHRCCCYRCAKRTLNTTKRCPICNRAVNKVVKIYTS